jgi:hypothetical protein
MGDSRRAGGVPTESKGESGSKEAKAEAKPKSERESAIEVLYFPKAPGHISIKIKNIGTKFTGFYLSHGGAEGANLNYSGGEALDTKFYGVKPLRIPLDLPKDIDGIKLLSQLTKIQKTFDPGSYKMFSNNCAFSGLQLLKDPSSGIGYPELRNASCIATTTPVYTASQACMLGLAQIERNRRDITLEAKEPNLDVIVALIRNDVKRLETEKNLSVISSAVTDWKTLNFPRKIAKNVLEGSELDIKNSKIQLLTLLEDLAAETKVESSPAKYQQFVDELYKTTRVIGARTADRLTECLSQFPYEKLPGADHKLTFLLSLQTTILKNEAVLKKQTKLGRSLPDGVALIKTALAQLNSIRPDQAEAQNGLIQKIFLEVQNELQSRAGDSSKSRSKFMKAFYNDWTAKSESWRGEIEREFSIPTRTRSLSTSTSQISSLMHISPRSMSQIEPSSPGSSNSREEVSAAAESHREAVQRIMNEPEGKEESLTSSMSESEHKKEVERILAEDDSVTDSDHVSLGARSHSS